MRRRFREFGGGGNRVFREMSMSRHPEHPGLEEEMTNSYRYSFAAATLLLAVLVAAPACQCESEVPIKVTEHVVGIEPAESESKYHWKKIPEIDVSSGDTIRFISNEHTIWVMIPDNRFKVVEGGGDWVVSKSFTAFTLSDGYAIVKMDECLTPAETKETIHYSIMVRAVEDPSDRWDYVHGENPPPRMIVRPRG